MNRISRAGISRSEPLLCEFSTAGNDPESYGRKRYEYGKQVESGEREDQGFFFTSYEAPQDLTDDQLAQDPVKYGKLANPAWGHTVHQEEFISDYNRSKASLTTLADFRMYRLNQWQSAANPWLNMSDWVRCEQSYTEADLAGQECYAGLDLARVRDTCALVLIFPVGDDQYRQLPYFWLPQKRAENLRDKVSYLEWAASGFIKLTEGDVTDYGIVRNDIIALSKRFNIRKLAFDDCYAHELIQRLIEEDSIFTLDEVCEFGQTIRNFASPTDGYEAAIISHTLHHPGNDCLTWQAGNTNIKQDYNANKRPVKPTQGNYKSIDGMVAGIMAFALATQFAATEYVPGSLLDREPDDGVVRSPLLDWIRS